MTEYKGVSSATSRSKAGDLVIHRGDGIPACHLATVVDDAEQGVTEVMRGIDLLQFTPKQVYLQKIPSLTTPNYGHIPVLTDRSGCKLSKQTGALAVDDRRPAWNLLPLLDLLGFQPEPDLRAAAPSEILAWAVEHWDPVCFPSNKRCRSVICKGQPVNGRQRSWNRSRSNRCGYSREDLRRCLPPRSLCT